MCTFLVLPRQRIGTSRASVLDDLGARLPSPRHAMAQERQLRYEGCNPTKIIAEFETQTTWYLRTSEKPIGRVAGQPRSAPLARKARRARLCTTSHMSSRCYEAVRSKLRRSAGSAGLFPARLSHCMVFRKIPSWDRALDVAYQPPAAQCGHN